MKLSTTKINWAAIGVNTSRAAYFGAHLIGTPMPPNSNAYPLLEPLGDWATSSLSATIYAPSLTGQVFNVLDYGADPTSETDSTDAIRDAIAAAKAWTEANAFGQVTIYIPTGIYTCFCSTGEIASFTIHFGNVVIEGDGPTETILNFRARDGNDPNEPIMRRGHGFTTLFTPSPIDGITIRGLRATGNAQVTASCGVYSGDDGSLEGWDTTHKFLGVWGEVTGVVVEDCELDCWRGEILYSGGGSELGTVNVSRCILRNANASALSMGGRMTIEDCEFYACLNATECFCFSNGWKIVRNCTIEPRRGWPSGFNVGTFGLVYHGFLLASFLVEDNYFGETASGAVLIAEFGSNVTVQNNTFVDTQGVYRIYQGQYVPYPDAVPAIENNRFENWLITGNTFTALTKDVAEAIYGYVDAGVDWTISNNTLVNTGENKFGIFIRDNGATGDYIVSGNVIPDAQPYYPGATTRPLWTGNTVTGTFADGEEYFSYLPASDPTPLAISPVWNRANITAIGAIQREITLTSVSLYPDGATLEIRAESLLNGSEIKPDAGWNSLTRGYMVYQGMVLVLEKNGTTGVFDFVSYSRGTPFSMTLQELPVFGFRDADDISFWGGLTCDLAPTVAHTYSKFSGVAIGETVTITHNANVTIEHVPGVMEISTGVDFVASGSGSLSATRNSGGVLQINIPGGSNISYNILQDELAKYYRDENFNYIYTV